MYCSRIFRLSALRPSTSRSGRQSLTIKAVGWDPEGVLGPPRGDWIARREISKERAMNADLDAKMRREAERAKAELEAKRAARQPPTTPPLLIDFLLDTEADEMEFEFARCLGFLNDGFFKELNQQISMEKFKPQPNEDRMTELEALKAFVETGLKRLEVQKAKVVAPADRLKKLLAASDKKAMLLEMAGKNEIDGDLIRLIDINIESARQAKQPEQVIDFLTKIKMAAAKYVTTA